MNDDVLELTPDMILRPSEEQWRRGNHLFGHPRGCRCSTCRLVAELAVLIERRSNAKRPRP